MSGAFYGSLAASASVFVAILTALLINNYVRIKSEQRQVKNELRRIVEELTGLKSRRDNHQKIINELVEKRESEYRKIARKQVDEFIENEIPLEDSPPIEKMRVDSLYRELIDFHHYESPEELENKPIKYRHRDVLEERMDEIENKTLNSIIPAFASKYAGRGRSIDPDSEFQNLVEEIREKEETKDNNDTKENKQGEKEPNISVEANFRDPLSLDDFIEKYKEKHGLSTLQKKTREALKVQYEEVVDKDRSSSVSDSLSSLQRPRWADALAATDALNEPVSIDFPTQNVTIGLSISEQQKLSTEREKLRDVENEISILENRKKRLEREREGLRPEDLNSTLFANVTTIILSVVVPIAAYLATVTGTNITAPQILSNNEINIFLSWFLGLAVVFVAIYIRINND